MEYLRTTDNNCGNRLVDINQSIDLKLISGKNLSEIERDNPNLLVFPSSLDKTADGLGNDCLFSISNDNKLTTNNMMGFIGINGTQLTISSRFYPDENDYFLHYMLQKVFSINLFDLKFETNQENIWDIFLIYLFPYYLKKAVNQGIYKEYVRKKYNDPNLKGAIDINRHIKENIPFNGLVSYITREHTFDNRMTQLIRHTQEFIKSRGFSTVLVNDKKTREAVNLIDYNTPAYNRQNRQKIVQANKRSLNHAFYTEYEILRKICLQILRRDGLSYGKQDQNIVYGIVFDGAWLWEEFINTYLSKIDFVHPTNKDGENPIYLFEGNNAYKRYPDFYKDKMILEAKYKKMDSIDRDDMNQIISYIYVLKSEKGGFVYPIEKSINNEIRPVGRLNGYSANIDLYGIGIPTECKNLRELGKVIDINFHNIVKDLL